jgi:hypothetical protein
MRNPLRSSRGGAAVVELAIILPLLLLLLVGIWVVGRLIEVHQTVDWAAREGARVASQGQIVDLENDYVQITEDYVEDTVKSYFKASKISDTDVEVTYENIGPPPSGPAPSGTTDPWQAKKGDRLIVTVRLPHDSVRLPVPTAMLGWALPNPTHLESRVEIQSVQDDPFVINDVLPTWTPTWQPITP